MDPARWQEIKSVFQSALEYDPGAARAAFLNASCSGNETLRSEVEALIAADEAAPDFIDESAFEVVTSLLAAEEIESPAGRRIGSYEIVREIGRGGMGAVYLAERADDQYHKQVAIKLIKRGMDTDFIVRRFRNERQILANLDHPNIAGLVDGGTTEDGLPYFVMEYIDGQPIDEYADTRQLSISERLKLFRSICSAVHFAHQNLVIHRDLKPSNIVVTEDGTVKLLDFGIAKILRADQSQATEVTDFRMMTAEYASPEQVRGLPMTTASDTYSLGVILFKLLTGRRPYYFRNKLPDEVARVICEKDAPRPSTVVGRTEDQPKSAESKENTLTSASISEARDATPKKLSRQLRGDLDNIVLMSMRKEAQRRYASVEHFSEDIRRYLENLPINARKDTFSYHSSKFVRRNKIAVAAAAFVLIALLAGIAATTWQARVARAERNRAERRFNEVRQIANTFLFEFHDAIENLPGSTPARELVVKRALEYLNDLTQESGNDPRLQRELSAAYFKVGDVQGRPNYANLGDYDGALESHRRSLVLRKGLAVENPHDAQVRLELAQSYDRVGEILAQTGSLTAALESSRRGLEINEALAAAEPSNTAVLSELALLYRHTADVQGFPPLINLGDSKGAMENYLKSLAICEKLSAENPGDREKIFQLASSYHRLGDLLAYTGPLNGALDGYNKGLALLEAASAAEPNDAKLKRDVGLLYTKIGKIHLISGDIEGALKNMRKSQEIFDGLVAADKANLTVLLDVGNIHRWLGLTLTKTSDKAEALEHFRKALDIFNDLLAKSPSSATPRINLSRTHTNLAELFAATGEVERALDNSRKSLGFFKQMGPALLATPQTRSLKAVCLEQMGACYAMLASKLKSAPDKRAENWREARDWFQQSLEIWQELRDNGRLGVAELGKPDDVAHEIAMCDKALAK
ncbi:MAG: protein kinase domain-containing protein [Pyrinomonadaceae bacterium]